MKHHTKRQLSVLFKQYINLEDWVVNDGSSHIYFMLGDRGIGKSTALYKRIKQKIDQGQQFVFIRNLQTEVKVVAKEFEIYMKGKVIYDNESGFLYWKSKTGRKLKNKPIVGIFTSFTTFQTLRSTNAVPNLGIVVWDELCAVKFNPKNMFEEFIQFGVTIFRNNKNIEWWCMCNKDITTNEILNQLDVRFENKNKYQYIHKRYGKFIEINAHWLPHFNLPAQKDNPFWDLAKVNEKMDSFLSHGTGMEDNTQNILNFRSIKKWFHPMFKITIAEEMFVVGNLDRLQKGVMYVKEYYSASSKERVRTIALDNISMGLGIRLANKSDKQSIAKSLMNHQANGTLWFETFHARDMYLHFVVGIDFFRLIK